MTVFAFLLLDHPMTAREIAAELGTSASYLGKLVRGDLPMYQPMRRKVGRFFRVSPDTLREEITAKQVMLVVRDRIRQRKAAG